LPGDANHLFFPYDPPHNHIYTLGKDKKMETNKEQKEPEWTSFDDGIMPLVILYGLIIGIIILGIIILILDALGIIKIF
jgi:hypothetical protein